MIKLNYSDAFLRKANWLFAKLWNSKWKTSRVDYPIKKGERRKMTDFLTECVNDPILDPILVQLDREKRVLGDASNERVMYKIEQFVISNIRYTTDRKTWDQVEYWQMPMETWSRRSGDCEDGAILILALAYRMGIPAYRLKLCAGWVKLGKERSGHAYVIFLRNNQTWTICDWSYWPKRSLLRNRMEHRYNPNYQDIWWTSNWEYSWAQHDVKLGL